MILAPTLSASSGSGAAIERPTFSRDFAGEKSLNNGTGPAITFTRGSSATYFNAAGVLTTATTNEPRFDHNPSTGASLGLLIEEARTNSIRNSQAGGAVAGSPGTMPTNWAASTTSNGLSREIVATGTVGGFSYIDIRYNGTTTAGSGTQIQNESATQIVAAAGETWTASAYVQLVSGSLSGITWRIQNWYHDSAGTFIVFNGTNFTPTSILTRVTHTGVVVATATRIRSMLQFFYGSGTAVDFTLRIAAPQLEQGAFPTSYIPTTTAAATRAADSAVVTPISSFYNQSEGTLFGEAQYINSDASLISVDDGTHDNRLVAFIRQASTTRLPALVRSSASDQSAFSNQAYAAGFSRVILAYKANDLATTVNGLTVQTDTSATIPAVTTMRFGSNMNPAFMNGHIRRIAYYPKRLSNTLLQQLTT